MRVREYIRSHRMQAFLLICLCLGILCASACDIPVGQAAVSVPASAAETAEAYDERSEDADRASSAALTGADQTIEATEISGQAPTISARLSVDDALMYDITSEAAEYIAAREAAAEETDYSSCSWFPKDAPRKRSNRLLIIYKGSQSAVAYKAVDGKWTVERIMVCSTGRATPTGDYDLKGERYDFHPLFDATGQYCTRIIPHYLVHSLPYDPDVQKQSACHDRMEIEEYEKLGTISSKGCIRMLCADAKWVYDNCRSGTPLRIVKESGPEQPAVPPLIYCEPYMTDDGFGWDPTDPHPDNPYAAIYGTFE